MTPSPKLFGILLLVLLVTGCIGKAENTPISTLTFELTPPISEELVSAIGWTDSDMNSVYTTLGAKTGVGGINRWSIAADSNGSFNTIILTELNSSVLNKEWQIFENLTGDTRDPIDFTPPNIFYRESYFITQLCDEYSVSAYTGDPFFFEQVFAGLKKYNCSPAYDFTPIFLKVPGFSIFNQELVNYMKSKGYRLSSARFVGTAGNEKADFGFLSGASSVDITQTKENYKNYTYTLDLNNRMAKSETLAKNESFKGGNYWLFKISRRDNESKTMESKVVWHCNSAAGLTIGINSYVESPETPFSFEDMKEISNFMC